MIRIDDITVKKDEVDDVVPCTEPGVFVWIYNNILKTLFVIFLLLVVVEAPLEVVTTSLDVVEAIHISLLLGLIGLVQSGYQEVDLVLHLFDMSAQLTPVLTSPFLLV